ncbi:MAG TPA: DUF357 domain-containing protein, partial [Nautiliaceae bacterium]|nr:DUF357 domain-containing protein [Nautiliaceae bacterium]
MLKIKEKDLEELIYITDREIEKLKKIFKLQEDLKDLEVFDLINSYFKDLLYFYEKKDYIKAFELVNYIWGFLDILANL